MYRVVSIGGTTLLQWLLLALFTVNFSWIALAFTSAVVGFVAILAARVRPPMRPARLTRRTAIVMPVYNESTARTFGAPAAIRESVEATGQGAAFDYFILSDTTHPDVWIAEERAFSRFASGSGRKRASITVTGPRTITARPATSPISSRDGAGITRTCSCSMPTA